MEKMNGMSKDLLMENIEQLKHIFPQAVTEGKIDFDVLKELLGEAVETDEEFYRFTWHGKSAARRHAMSASGGTLRPCPGESSGKDGTPGKFDSENLYIEGDNLEVLKLLQGAYHKKVKMIYIDPPYNTGKDFVYPDNFRDSIANYKALTGQTDAEGNATRANPETSGRYHTDWLNMMYPRLILARNLLTDDGVIFISIDDNEQDNLRKICNEVFGEENFITTICWQKFHSVKSNSEGNISKSHDFILVYSKLVECASFVKLPMSEKALDVYKNPDNDPRGRWRTAPLTVSLLTGARGEAFKRTGKSNGLYPLISPTGKSFLPTPGRCWFAKNTIESLEKDDRIWWGKDGNSVPMQKVFLAETGGVKAITTFWDHENFGSNKQANEELKKLFPENTQETANFPTPKPTLLIKNLIRICCDNPAAIILDFFSGSSSTAHAVIWENAFKNQKFKFIMVQLPESVDSGSFENICEIGKERIRRAAKKIREELTTKDRKDTKKEEENSLFDSAGELSRNLGDSKPEMDWGFRVLKLDTSNYVPWNVELTEDELLINRVDNLVEGRSAEDLLYEVLLKNNQMPTLPIEKLPCGENTIHVVAAGSAFVCLDRRIKPETVAEIVRLRQQRYAAAIDPQAILRDSAFERDDAKLNAVLALEHAGFKPQSIIMV